MKAVRKQLTYANVMSSIAVFLVLAGGTAFAASQLGKNSVGAKQLKKNSVTAAKLKRNAVTGAKIKPGAVTGAKIDEGTLGTVPSANTANSANLAASLQGFQRNKLRLSPTPAADFTTGLNAGPETMMFTAGPLTITAKCFVVGSTLYSIAQIKSATDGSIYYGEYNYTSGTNLLNPSTPGTDRILQYEGSSGNYGTYNNEYTEFGAVATDGTTIQGDIQMGVKTGNVGGAYGAGDGCLFAGTMFTI